MKSVYYNIAKENYLKSGYITLSEKNRFVSWFRSKNSQSPTELSSALGNALRNRYRNMPRSFYASIKKIINPIYDIFFRRG